MPLARRIDDVVAATAPSEAHGLVASSKLNTPSSPAASASWAACPVRAADLEGGSMIQYLRATSLIAGRSYGPAAAPLNP